MEVREVGKPSKKHRHKRDADVPAGEPERLHAPATHELGLALLQVTAAGGKGNVRVSDANQCSAHEQNHPDLVDYPDDVAAAVVIDSICVGRKEDVQRDHQADGPEPPGIHFNQPFYGLQPPRRPAQQQWRGILIGISLVGRHEKRVPEAVEIEQIAGCECIEHRLLGVPACGKGMANPNDNHYRNEHSAEGPAALQQDEWQQPPAVAAAEEFAGLVRRRGGGKGRPQGLLVLAASKGHHDDATNRARYLEHVRDARAVFFREVRLGITLVEIPKRDPGQRRVRRCRQVVLEPRRVEIRKREQGGCTLRAHEAEQREGHVDW